MTRKLWQQAEFIYLVENGFTNRHVLKEAVPRKSESKSVLSKVFRTLQLVDEKRLYKVLATRQHQPRVFLFI